MTLPTGGLIRVEVLWDTVDEVDRYPFSIPALRRLDDLDLDHPVTFFVGENGSGKSTLLEAIAVAAGLNPEGGTRNLRFTNRATESELHESANRRSGAERRQGGASPSGVVIRALRHDGRRSRPPQLIAGTERDQELAPR